MESYMAATLRQRKLNRSYHTPCTNYVHETDECIAFLPVAQCCCGPDLFMKLFDIWYLGKKSMIDKGILTAETEVDYFILANISETQKRKKTHITDSNHSHEAYIMFLAKP